MQWTFGDGEDEAGLDEIGKNRGTQFDAAVVDAMLRLVREKGYVIPE